MKLKFLLIIFAVSALGLASNANPIQKLILKDGTVLQGYISMQRPGENLQFTAERAEVVLPDSLVSSYQTQEVPYAQLSEEWRAWAEENGALDGDGDARRLVLHTIITKGRGNVEKVRLIEKGIRYKYLDFSKKTHELKWDTISIIQYERRERNVINGVNRLYTLKNGTTIEGQYIEEDPGKTISVLDAEGFVNVFKTEDVLKYTVKKINASQDLLAQCPLLDVVVLKNEASYAGVIVEQNYNNDSNYLLLQGENGSTESIRFDDIARYRKEENKAYEPLYDILLKEGEIVINRQKTTRLPIRQQNGFMTVDLDSCNIEIDYVTPETEVVLEMNTDNTGITPTYRIVKITDKIEKKRVFSGFTFEDLINNGILPVSSTTSANKTTKFIYRIAEQGYYVIYDDRERNAILFRIK